MTRQRIILIGIIIVLAVHMLYARHRRAKFARELTAASPNYIPIEGVLAVHERRIKEQVDLLKKQTLEETFVYLLDGKLLDGKQYTYPYFTQSLYKSEMEKVLSTRSTLKVFQQFDMLPQERKLEKLQEFSQKAIKDFGIQLANVRYEADEKKFEELKKIAEDNPTSAEFGKVKYALCVSLLLAARAGEFQLLVNLLDKMQQIVDTCVDRVSKDETIPHDDKGLLIYVAQLEDNCILTILLYALKWAGKDVDVPYVNNVKQKTVSLCRWDSPLTHYDFAVWHGDKELNPEDVVEQFVVYEFPGNLFLTTQKVKKRKLSVC